MRETYLPRIGGVNALRDAVRTDRWDITSANASVCAVAGEVRVVALSWTPGVALGSKVEFPPDAVEDVGAGVAAVHLGGDGEVGCYFPVGVAEGLGSVGLEGGCAVGWVGLNGNGVEDCACCGCDLGVVVV